MRCSNRSRSLIFGTLLVTPSCSCLVHLSPQLQALARRVLARSLAHRRTLAQALAMGQPALLRGVGLRPDFAAAARSRFAAFCPVAWARDGQLIDCRLAEGVGGRSRGWGLDRGKVVARHSIKKESRREAKSEENANLGIALADRCGSCSLFAHLRLISRLEADSLEEACPVSALHPAEHSKLLCCSTLSWTRGHRLLYYGARRV